MAGGRTLRLKILAICESKVAAGVGELSMGLFNAIKQIVDTARALPPAVDPADAEARSHSRYHQRVVFVGVCCAAIGAAFGLIITAVVTANGMSGGNIRKIVLMPVMYGAGGFVFGMALMCVVAPRAFLAGPIGAPWMKLIGTKSVPAARIICLLFSLFVTVSVVGIGLLIALND
jgi:hypothetical protein